MNYYIPKNDYTHSDIDENQIINKRSDLDLRTGINAFDKYFNTLSKVGYIKSNEKNSALIFTFLVDCYIKSNIFQLDNEDMKAMFDILNCLYDKSCIFDN